MIVSKSEYGLVTASLVLIAVHIIVSLTYAIISFHASSKSKNSGKVLMWSGFGWLLSLIVCVVVGIFLVSTMAYEVLDATFPCPIQISMPGGSDRKDIENFMNDPASMAVFGNRIVLPYDKKRTYLVVTGYYLKKETVQLTGKSAEMYAALLKLTEKYHYIPIGYLEQGMVFALSGEEFWPEYKISTFPPQPQN